MQMISKNNKGVTMMALIITIIVLSIILGITLNYGLSEIHSVTNKRNESDLAIVQEAVMQRYALVKSADQLEIIATPITTNTAQSSDSNRPAGFVGTRLASSSEITNKGFSGISYKQQYSSGVSDLVYEKYYYLLTENDLKDLGAEKGDDGKERTDSNKECYIVNYFTGEIFDIANKKYYKTGSENPEQIYTQPVDINMENKSYDFNDN